jgi:hypothetical protein
VPSSRTYRPLPRMRNRQPVDRSPPAALPARPSNQQIPAPYRMRWGCGDVGRATARGAGAGRAALLRVLAQRYGVEWTPGTFGRFTGAIGGGALLWWGLRYGLREALKFIPVIGFAAAGGLNAAAAFAVTVGIGEAACVWLGYQRDAL